MKSGVRALGVAESYGSAGRNGDSGESVPGRSTLAGAVTTADRVVDGFAYGTCTVGGTDATDAIVDLVCRLDREDVRYVMVAGIALAWYNVLDLFRIHEAVERPVLSVTFEESTGLESALTAAFEGDARRTRLETYREQPPRRRVEVNDGVAFVRAVGVDDGEARDVVRTFTPEGGRPEPLRVARLAARAADRRRVGRT